MNEDYYSRKSKDESAMIAAICFAGIVVVVLVAVIARWLT